MSIRRFYPYPQEQRTIENTLPPKTFGDKERKKIGLGLDIEIDCREETYGALKTLTCKSAKIKSLLIFNLFKLFLHKTTFSKPQLILILQEKNFFWLKINKILRLTPINEHAVSNKLNTSTILFNL